MESPTQGCVSPWMGQPCSAPTSPTGRKQKGKHGLRAARGQRAPRCCPIWCEADVGSAQSQTGYRDSIAMGTLDTQTWGALSIPPRNHLTQHSPATSLSPHLASTGLGVAHGHSLPCPHCWGCRSSPCATELLHSLQHFRGTAVTNCSICSTEKGKQRDQRGNDCVINRASCS